MIEQVLPRIYRIHVPLPGNPLKELNSFLIKGDGHNLLIDTGFRQEPCRVALQSALDELGVHREETDVLVTHMHSDHAGMCDLFVGEGKRIYVSGIDRKVMQKEGMHQLRQAQDKMFRSAGMPEFEVNEQNRVNPARAMGVPNDIQSYSDLENGDVLDVDGYQLKAILTPGHTPGHMCFWLEEYGAMFLGDHVLFDITPNITAWPHLPDSLGVYMEHLKMIRNYDVAIPLPAHRASGDFKARVDQLLSHHAQRLEETLKIVRSRPEQCAYDITSKMTWRIRCNSWEDFPIPQKWFAVGECLSHLERLMVQGQVGRELKDDIYRYYPL